MPVYTRIFENGTARLRMCRAVCRRNDTETGFFGLPFRNYQTKRERNIEGRGLWVPAEKRTSPLSPLPSLISAPLWFDSFWTTKKCSRWNTARQIFSRTVPFSKIQVDIGKQMLPDGEKWPNCGWWAAFSAFLGHFSPFHASIYPNFWKRYRSAEVSERCVASTFLSFRNYLQSGQYKNYECQQSFFLLPSLPSLLLYLPTCGLIGSGTSKKPSFSLRWHPWANL